MELKKTFEQALKDHPDVTSMFFTDNEGVLVLSVGDEMRNRQTLITSHQVIVEQVPKLQLGNHQSSVFFYENTQIIICTMGSLSLFVIARGDANTGHLLKLREKLMPMIPVIESVLPPPKDDDEPMFVGVSGNK